MPRQRSAPGTSSRTDRGRQRLGAVARKFNPKGTMLAAEGLTLTAIVAGDFQTRKSQKMPRPAPIVATLGFFALLSGVGALSEGSARVASLVGGLVALTALVSGARGVAMIGLVRQLTGYTRSLTTTQ